MSEEINVSKEMAVFIADQIGGQFCGHMANVPNNPTLFGIARAHLLEPYDLNQNQKYAEFFRKVADALDYKKE